MTSGPSTHCNTEPISLKTAKERLTALVIPDYKPDFVHALFARNKPDDLGLLDNIDGMDTLRQCLKDVDNWNIPSRIDKYIGEYLGIYLRARDFCRSLLSDEEPSELDRLIPKLAALGARFNQNERDILYAGTLRLFREEEDISMAPLKGMPHNRIRNALHCVPNVTEDVDHRHHRERLLEPYLKAVHERGILLYWEPPRT